MNEKTPLWQTDFGLLLRWVLFLIIGFVLTSIVQMVPPQVAGIVKTYIPESTFQAIIFAVLAVPVLLALGGLWCLGVLMIPYFNCRYIAPSTGIAAVLHGILFCLFEGVYLLASMAGGASWIFIGYQFLFSGITAGGIIIAYNEIDLSRIRRWLSWITPWRNGISSQPLNVEP